MTVNVKTLPISTTRLITTEMTTDDMNFVLNNIKNKLESEPENLSNTSTAYNRSYVRQTEKYEYKKDVEPPSPLKVPFEELLIKSKLTRVAKFPIRRQSYKTKRQELYDIVNTEKGNIIFDRPSAVDYIHDLGNMNTFPERRNTFKGKSVRKMHHSHLGKTGEKDKNRYTDYFNDLIMWHSDILNLDGVPNSISDNILKTVQSDTGTTYTTPNINGLLIGLKEMNDYLDLRDNINSSVVFKDAVGVNHFQNQLDDQGLIRSVAMDDNTLVTSKDMIIKGEAKYYQYNKPINLAKKPSSSNLIIKLNTDDRRKGKIQFKRKGN